MPFRSSLFTPLPRDGQNNSGTTGNVLRSAAALDALGLPLQIQQRKLDQRLERALLRCVRVGARLLERLGEVALARGVVLPHSARGLLTIAGPQGVEDLAVGLGDRDRIAGGAGKAATVERLFHAPEEIDQGEGDQVAADGGQAAVILAVFVVVRLAP